MADLSGLTPAQKIARGELNEQAREDWVNNPSGTVDTPAGTTLKTLGQVVADAAQRISEIEGTPVARVISLAALRALTPLEGDLVACSGRASAGDGYEGDFVWLDGDWSAECTADPLMGVWVPLTGDDGLNGAFRRVFTGLPDVAWWGAKPDYNTSDGSGTDNTDAINAALAFAAYAKIGPGFYKCDNMIDPPIHGGLLGPAPLGKITSQSEWNSLGKKHAIIVPTNDGSRTTHTLDADITSANHGTLQNPASGESYTTDHGTRSDYYELVDFTNQDASASDATPATAREFTAAYRLKRGGCLINVGIRPPRDNSLDYAVSPDFCDDIDIGLWAENDVQSTVQGCAVVGDFRMLAFFKGVYQIGDGLTPEGDRAWYNNNHFEGHTGVSYRTPNTHRVIAADATTVTLPWSKSHRFPATGTLSGRSFSGSVEYTSVSKSGGTLVFTCATNPVSAGFGAAETCYLDRGTNWGMAETVMTNTFIRDLANSSFRMSTNSYYTTPFARQGKGLEISGAFCRGLHFKGVTIHVRDDVGRWFGDCGDVTFEGYIEAKYINEGAKAVRDIGLSMTALNAGVGGVTYPGGECTNIRDIISEDVVSQMNRKPMYDTSGGTSRGRFGTTGGLWSPEAPPSLSYFLRTDGDGSSRLRAPYTRASVYPWAIEDWDGNLVMALIRSNGKLTSLVEHIFEEAVALKGAVEIDFTDAGLKFTNDAGDTYFLQNLEANSSLNVKFNGSTKFAFNGTTGSIHLGSISAPGWYKGSGTPEGNVTAEVGSFYSRTNGGAGTSFYVKESGSGNTGWVAK